MIPEGPFPNIYSRLRVFANTYPDIALDPFPNSRITRTPIRQMTVIKVPVISKDAFYFWKEYYYFNPESMAFTEYNILTLFNPKKVKSRAIVLPRANAKKVRVRYGKGDTNYNRLINAANNFNESNKPI
jgi:hypothetical protein